MSDVPGRCWPVDLPFSGGVTDSATGKPYVRDGFVCDSRPGDFAFKGEDFKGSRDPNVVKHLEFLCPRTGKYCGSIRVGFPKNPQPIRPGSGMGISKPRR